MSFFCGIDIGASATKVALIDAGGAVVGRAVLRSGVDFAASARRGLDVALSQAGIGFDQITATFSCGYGRKNVEFAADTRTEIACHAAGAYHFFPRQLTVVDIGGQDNKIIKLDHKGRRTSFKMNRKCAAGTGAFLEEMALRLDLPLESLNDLAAGAKGESTLGAFCTVFTATEVLAKIRAGVAVADLVKGLFRSVIKRVREMDTFEGQVVMTGGVAAHNPYLVEMLAQELGSEVATPPEPQIIGAMGAALIAARENIKTEASASAS